MSHVAHPTSSDWRTLIDDSVCLALRATTRFDEFTLNTK